MSLARPLTILNVDDNEPGRYAITRVLRQAGFQVREAATAAEALNCLSQPPDLVILDVNLPDMSGLEVAQRIKANPVTAHIPVIHVSATSVEHADQVRGLRSGAEGYLVEPVPGDHLLALVEALLRYRDLQQQTEQRFLAVWQVAADALALSDADGTVVAANPAYFDLYGYPPEQVLGQNFAIIFPEAQRPAAQDAYRQVFASEAVPPTFESTIQRADGSRRMVETRINFITEHGRRTAMLSAIRDVTERRQAEAALEQKSARLQLLSDLAARLLTANDIDRLVDEIFHRLAGLIELAAYFHFRTIPGEPDRLRLAAYHGVAPETAASIKVLRFGDLVCGTVAQQRVRTVVEAVQQSSDPKLQAIRRLGMTAYACFPLLTQAGLYGTVSFARRGADRFEPDELALLQSVSDLVGTAIERQQAEAAQQAAVQRAEQNADRIARLQTITSKLSEALLPGEVFDTILDEAGPMLGCQAGLVMLARPGDEARPWLELARAVGYPESHLDVFRRVPPTASLPTAAAMRQAEPVWLESRAAMAGRFPALHQLHLAAGCEAAAVLALVVSGRLVGGIVFSFRQAQAFSAEDRAYIVALAQQCAQALERTRLYQAERQAREALEVRVQARTGDLQQANQRLEAEIAERIQAQDQLAQSYAQLRALAERLEAAREDERLRIAREIHDVLGGALTAHKLEVAALKRAFGAAAPGLAERAGEIAQRIDETIQTVRRLATELRPAVLDDLGLVAAIEWQLGEFHSRSGIVCDFSQPAGPIEPDPARDIAVFRVFQETLTNILRHAQATRVAVSLERQPQRLVLRVRDDGRGLDPGALRQARSLGLTGMRERISQIGGELEIAGAPQQGTTVLVKVPLDKDQP